MVNPDGHAGLRSLGIVAVAGMAALFVIMLITAFGLDARRRWAWRLAVTAIAINAVSDLAAPIGSGDPRTLIGVPIATLIVWWLTRRDVRSRFT
jgi:uncharacterized membrane protein (DUF2068 family)